MRKAIAPVEIAFLTLLAVTTTSDISFTQPGSTGGDVGKIDKSISGGGEIAPAVKPSGSNAQSRPLPAPQTGTASVAGRWSWTADCQSGHYTAGFQITQGMSGEISGSFFSDPVNGSLAGNVSKGTITFTRSTWIVTQHWTGQLGQGGRQIVNGSITGNESCTWAAVKQ